MVKMKIGYGNNGHQIHGQLSDHPEAELVAVAAIDAASLPDELKRNIRIYDTLDELLNDDEVELVSLCSPLRSEQAGQAVACMEAGKHVYGEKPSATTEEDLHHIMEVYRSTGKKYHEMSEPFWKFPPFPFPLPVTRKSASIRC